MGIECWSTKLTGWLKHGMVLEIIAHVQINHFLGIFMLAMDTISSRWAC